MKRLIKKLCKFLNRLTMTPLEKYLSDSSSLEELERRQRNLNRTHP